MAAVPRDISFLLEKSISPTNNIIPNITEHVTCQGANDLMFIVSVTTLNNYLSNTEFTGQEIITYRGMKIATWFNSASGIFEGEILFMNHQLDILAKQDHSLFENIVYKYIRQDNDFSLSYDKNQKDIQSKTFKLREYVSAVLIHSVDGILAIIQSLPVDDAQFKFIASHFNTAQ